MGQRCLKGKWDTGKQRNQKAQMTILSHWGKNKQQTQRGPTGLGQITPSRNSKTVRQETQRQQKRARKWAEGGKAHDQAKTQPWKEQALKNEKPKNGSRHKKPRMGGKMCRQTSRPRRTREQQADFGYTWKWSTRKTQTLPTCTQPIQEVVRSWVRGKGAWFSGGEKGKHILGFLLKLFWGKCPAGMTYHPKEAKMSWDH